VLSKATKAFTLRKPYKGAIGLTISSPYIREHLLRAIGIELYNGVAIGASHTVLNWPFSPLYHHLGDIRANVHNDHNATKTERNNIDILHYFVTEGAPAKLYEDIRSKIAQGFITYDEVWALFRPGDLAAVKDSVGNDDIAQIVSVKLERSPRGSIYGPQCWRDKNICTISMEILLIYILKEWKRRLVFLWQRTRVHENSVKGFHGGDEYVAILYEISTLGSSYTRYSSIPNTQYLWYITLLKIA
jgi:hypothetical protein